MTAQRCTVARRHCFEQRVNREARDCGLDTVSLPFALTGGISAVGCYLNYLETETVIFLPVFSIEQEGAGVAAPLGCVICLQLGDVAVFSLCAQYFLNVRGGGGITTLSALYVLLKRRTAACQNGSFAVF